ncbi:OmpA family protein [Flavobacterium piscinae]|uniref:OmpA family protein n=1 Tax=Flavobacterium piscinae TaxID=2506424 RepID=UPI00198E8726|nr:OmpA family protein [Flavobacterium piscinae]MBC8883635.1 OmpA family protein [Flavobacterium piscinae]
MIKTWTIGLLFLMQFGLFAQEEMVQSIYFETNQSDVESKYVAELAGFFQKVDSTRVESIEIFGYCDDVGKDDYNRKLSTDRANKVKAEITKSGIKNKIIVTIEGKGRILIDDDIEENLPEIRSKNRRVDVVLNMKPQPEEEIKLPGVYSTFNKENIVGDRIMLSDMIFERGSDKLSIKSKNQLDKIARMLIKNKNINIEVQGHVCCTPPNHKEAIDKGTKKRKLSHNRAEAVYKYLILKKVPKARMTFKGYGNTMPLGKSPELDRRVELVITKV